MGDARALRGRDARGTLRRHVRVIAAAALVGALVSGAVMVRSPTRYSAETSFFIEARSGASLGQALAGLAGQLGVLPTQSPTQSPSSFAQLASRREILTRVLEGRYPRARGDSVSLLELLVPRRSVDDSAARAERGRRWLERRVSVSVEPRTGVVKLGVTLEDPVLAAAVANRTVEALDQFNTQNRRSQGRARRIFVSGRAADAADTLRRAEAQLRDFYERNRQWRSSPILTFDEGRLQRQVALAQEVYLTLRRELETARIEEVNDTPALSVIDVAVPPTKPSGPHRMLNTVLAALFAAAVVWWVLFFVESARASGRVVPPVVERLYAGLPTGSR